MKIKSRKQLRKEFRKAKKVKRHEFFSKKKPKNKKNNFQNEQKEKVTDKKKPGKSRKGVEKVKTKREFKNLQEQLDYERRQEKREREVLERQIRQQRIKQLKSDNMKEDEEIKKLEKQMKMVKGKSKAFAEDGLDYLLDVCDKKISENFKVENTFEETDSEFESDLENIIGQPKKELSKKKRKIIEEEENLEEEEDELLESDLGEEEEEEEEEEEDMLEESDSEMESQPEVVMKKGKKRKPEEDAKRNKRVKEEEDVLEESDSEIESQPEVEVKKGKKRKPEEDAKGNKQVKEEEEEEEESFFSNEFEDDSLSENKEDEVIKSPEVTKMWEDIYGRTRDAQGNIIKTYTPPQLRKKLEGDEDDKKNEKLSRLKKQLKGLLNRLAESNMSFISNQVEQLYMSNSRNDMNETLCSLFDDSIMAEVSTPERLITEHAMLITVLHSNIGSEIGAHFLQFAVTEFRKTLESNPPVEDKRINNILLFVMHLYNFQVFHSKLMYDIINELLKNLEEKQIELLLTTFRTVGFNLRKDDPVALKALVIKVQERANSVSSGENSSRVKFMIEMLMAIKNNNMSKIPNYNPEFVEKLRKNLKVLVRKGNYSTELNIGLQDLLNADKHGRWWIVGSAWSGSAPSQPNPGKSKELGETATTEFSQKLLELARKQRMNTDIRRNVFCILMSAEDFLEAFEKLLKLKLKGAAEREIMNVLVHCALQEKTFNPYYVYLANKFCTFDRKYQMMLQCAVWDKIKEIKNALPVQVTNLAKFVGTVILEKGLPISILKVIEFSDLDKPTIKFMRQVLLAILVNEDRIAVAAVFKRIADSSKLKLFRESLRLFLQHFVLKNTKNVDREKASRLVEMVQLAEQAMESSDVKTIF